MRAAEAHRHAEALGRCRQRCRRRPRPGGAQQGQREQVGRDGDQRAGARGRRRSARRGRGPRRTRPGTAGAGRRTRRAARRSRQVDARAPRCRAARPGSRSRRSSAGACRRRPRTRAACSCDERRASVIASAAAVPSSSMRGVRGGEPGQVGDHRLEVEQRLEPALADLRLVRRVGRVPGGVLQHVAPDHAPACACRSSPGRSSTRAAGCGRRSRAVRRSSRPRSRRPAASSRPCQRIVSGIAASISSSTEP